MKKIIVFILSTVAITLTLCGCSESTQTMAGTVIDLSEDSLMINYHENYVALYSIDEDTIIEGGNIELGDTVEVISKDIKRKVHADKIKIIE